MFQVGQDCCSVLGRPRHAVARLHHQLHETLNVSDLSQSQCLEYCYEEWERHAFLFWIELDSDCLHPNPEVFNCSYRKEGSKTYQNKMGHP